MNEESWIPLDCAKTTEINDRRLIAATAQKLREKLRRAHLEEGHGRVISIDVGRGALASFPMTAGVDFRQEKGVGGTINYSLSGSAFERIADAVEVKKNGAKSKAKTGPGWDSRNPHTEFRFGANSRPDPKRER